MDYNLEDFVPLASLENQFGISKNAEIINFKTGHILSPYIGIDLYEHVIINLHGKRYRKRVHRLMAEAFFNNCKYIDHKDNIRSHNEFDNLQDITNSANVKKGYEQNDFINPHSGRGIWVIAQDKETLEEFKFKSLRACEKFTGVDRHRITMFLQDKRPNYTKYNFYYDE